MAPSQPRVIESSDIEAIAATITEYGLKTSTIGEWTGTIDDTPVLLRLVSPTEARIGRVKHVLGQLRERAAKATASPARPSPPARPGTVGRTPAQPESRAVQILRAARDSRWF